MSNMNDEPTRLNRRLPHRNILAFGAIFLAALAAWIPADAQRRVPESMEQVQLSYAPIVKRAAPAVVNVYTRKVVRSVRRSPFQNDPFFRRFFGENFGFGAPRERVENSLGSGVVVRSDGIIVTNNHVIRDADAVNVVLSDRREFKADLILADERSDLAVLRIDTEGEVLPVLEFGQSDDLEVGDVVLAIGNPFGVGQTVTSGIVSALARTATGITDYQFFIQTDAAINPGNSGGALVDMAGRLVGVNSAIYSRSGGSNGIGFAIPVSMVRTVVTGALGEGRVVRPWLGAGGQTVTGDIAEGLGLDRPNGVLINAVHPGGPADQAGLKVGDVILKIEDQDVIDPKGMQFRIATLQVGSRAKVNIWRDGRIKTLRLPLVAPPEVPARNVQTIAGNVPLAGATIANLSPALAYEMSMPFGQQGVVVMSVNQRSTAARMRLKPRDIIVSVNGQDVEEVEQLMKLLNQDRGSWEIAIRRGGQIITVRVSG